MVAIERLPIAFASLVYVLGDGRLLNQKLAAPLVQGWSFLRLMVGEGSGVIPFGEGRTLGVYRRRLLGSMLAVWPH